MFPTDPFVAGNLVLQDTIERLFVQNLYADIDRGLFLVRGENVLLLGEIVCAQHCLNAPPNLTEAMTRIWTKTIMFPNRSKKPRLRKYSR